MKAGLYILFFWLLLASCVKEANPSDPLVQQRLAEKKEEYLRDILRQCKVEAEEKAALYVDSLLSEQIQISLNDSIYFPMKPEKPVTKGPVILPAFTKPEPIFRDSVNAGQKQAGG